MELEGTQRRCNVDKKNIIVKTDLVTMFVYVASPLFMLILAAFWGGRDLASKVTSDS
jgi:hypothetical protein